LKDERLKDEGRKPMCPAPTGLRHATQGWRLAPTLVTVRK
jgi:hypothetical protein